MKVERLLVLVAAHVARHLLLVVRPRLGDHHPVTVADPVDSGRIALTTWTSDGNLFKMFQVMKAYMPPPAAPATSSPFEWGNTDRIRQLLGEDFELQFERAVSYYREPSAEAAWDTFSTSSGPTSSSAI